MADSAIVCSLNTTGNHLTKTFNGFRNDAEYFKVGASNLISVEASVFSLENIIVHSLFKVVALHYMDIPQVVSSITKILL